MGTNREKWTKPGAYVPQVEPPAPSPIVWDAIAAMCVKYGIDPAAVMVERPK